MTKANNVKAVWAGFVNNRPAVREDENGDTRCAVYPTKKDGKVDFMDVRKVWLVWPVTSKAKRR